MVKVQGRRGGMNQNRDAFSSSGGSCSSLRKLQPIFMALCLLLVVHREFTRASVPVATQTPESNKETGTTTNSPDLTIQVSQSFLRLAGGLSVATEEAPTTTSSTATTAAAASPPATATTPPINQMETGCTPLQKRLTKKALFDAKTIIDATKCPDSSAWLTDYLAEASATEPFIFLNFGCNKGYDALFMAETISRNTQVFNKQKWAQAIGIEDKGACGQGAASDQAIQIDPNLPKRPVQVHCIEAMPQTAARLIRATEITTAKAHGLQVYNYAMTGAAGGAPILFPNPPDGFGIENLGIGHCADPEHEKDCVEVPTRTVDEFVKEHVGPEQQRFHFMSVDVEGFDFTVLKGAQEALKRTDYVEFEYHIIGDWNTEKLYDAMVMLQGHGFVCYWAGVNQLWRLTGTCWLDHFEFHQWSNVACVAPERQPKLAAKMEQVFEDTLVQGVATTT